MCFESASVFVRFVQVYVCVCLSRGSGACFFCRAERGQSVCRITFDARTICQQTNRTSAIASFVSISNARLCACVPNSRAAFKLKLTCLPCRAGLPKANTERMCARTRIETLSGYTKGAKGISNRVSMSAPVVFPRKIGEFGAIKTIRLACQHAARQRTRSRRFNRLPQPRGDAMGCDSLRGVRLGKNTEPKPKPELPILYTQYAPGNDGNCLYVCVCVIFGAVWSIIGTKHDREDKIRRACARASAR